MRDPADDFTPIEAEFVRQARDADGEQRQSARTYQAYNELVAALYEEAFDR